MKIPVHEEVPVVQEHSGNHVPRDVEPAVLAHVDATLADPTARFGVVLLVGAPGNGVRTVLERGLAPRLAAHPGHAATVRGAWHPSARVQLCVEEADVPTEPPASDTAVRLLLVAATDTARLPGWVTAAGARSFAVDVLTLTETETFLEGLLGDAVDPATVRRLGTLAGFVPGMLGTLVTECRRHGCLERIGATWQLTEDPVRGALMPFVEGDLGTRTPAARRALFRIALSEPVQPADLDDDGLVADLVRSGDVRHQEDGLLVLRAPGVAEALRLLSPAEEQDRVHTRALADGRLRLDTLRWAARRGAALPLPGLLGLARECLERHDWAGSVAAAEHLESHPVTDDDAGTRCRIHLTGAYAARFLPDTDLALAQLDHAEELLAEVPPADLAELRTQVRVARADLLHFSLGDLAGALRELDTHDADPGATRAAAATVAAHRVVHLVYGGRTREARERITSDQRVLRAGPRRLRMRVALAETLALVAEGRPQRALRRTTLTAVQHAPGQRRALWVDEEIRVSYVVAALGSDGPAAYPSLERLLGSTRDDLFRPDLITFYLARASWLLAEGRITEAHRLGELALGSADLYDPSGVGAALVSLVAHTAALVGDRARAAELCERFPHVPLRSAAVIAGGTEANLAAARLLLGRPHEGTALRRTGARFAAEGRYGFAAEVLYAGVRFGLRRAAADLRELAPHLDGRLHTMRLAHATALLDEDPVALLKVARRLERAGLTLLAAEAAGAAAGVAGAPDAVRRRAEAHVAAFLESQPVAGHALLHRVLGPAWGVELTPREREVSELIAEGLTNAEIAARLGLSLRTVEGHVARLYRKTGASRRAPRRAGAGALVEAAHPRR